MSQPETNLDRMFYPESVAVVGASSGPDNTGRNIVQNLITWKYRGKVFPVNPRGEEVLGIKGYASIEEIPEVVDLAVVFVPARAVPDIMDQCAKKEISYMAIPSGGFGEFGESGEELTRVIKEKAREYGIRFVGPNGLTIINAENGLCLPFVTLKKRRAGMISIISQSGGVGISLVTFLDDSGSTFNKFISVGNKVDMDEVDFLEYLGKDPGTRVICMFLESVARGRRFLEVAGTLDKPVVVYKANTTEVGARTAASHTAALANDDTVIEGVFEQTGVIRVGTVRELMDIARAFSLPPMRGNNIAIVSQAGGYTVLTADRAYDQGFSFPQFGSEMLESIREHVRSDVISLGNPLDLGDVLSSDAIVYALDKVLAQDYVDGVVAVFLRRADSKYEGAYSGLSREVYADVGEIMKKYDKPVVLALITACRYFRDVQSRMDFPVFDSPEVAVEALAVMRDYYRGHPA
ncbi:MAG: CoA-binding protein [Actinobacteria bacterium]|nr:CoA-binding protein [Actinomycetota bacterium]